MIDIHELPVIALLSRLYTLSIAIVPYMLLMFHWGIDPHVRGELHFSGNGDLLQMKRYELLAAQWLAYIGILGARNFAERTTGQRNTVLNFLSCINMREIEAC